jgi:hypothetical protein
MLARGFQGSLTLTSRLSFSVKDVVVLVAAIVILAAVRFSIGVRP